MSEKELNSYRFGCGEEPTDEMLEQIMREVTQEATRKYQIAMEKYNAEMRRMAAEKKKIWAERINSVLAEQDVEC